MKNGRLFCKLLSALLSTCLVCFSEFAGGNAKAVACEGVVKYLSTYAYFGHGMVFNLFDEADVTYDDAWTRFGEILRKQFATYVVDACVDADFQDVDSINFLYLLLYSYRKFASDKSEDAARRLVKNLWIDFRNSHERSIDAYNLQRLFTFHSGKSDCIALEFKILDDIFKEI